MARVSGAPRTAAAKTATAPARTAAVHRRGRLSSETALVAAFEAMLQRRGPGGVGVNAVLGNARVGKRLLYKYFGDLRGLAERWARDRSDPLDPGPALPALRSRLARASGTARLTALIVDYADRLRAHPWALQVLLAELAPPAALGKSLHQMRRQIGSTHERLLIESGAVADAATMPTALMLHAAASYLALRARFAPDWNGLDLASEAGWRKAMRMLAAFDGKVAPPRPARRSNRHGKQDPT